MAPTYFPLGGNVASGLVWNAGSNGFWWSGTVISATNARTMYLDLGAVYPEGNDSRDYGFSLRRIVLCRLQNSNQTGSGAYATWLMAPTYFPRGGYVRPGEVGNAGSNGYWWSSTVSSSTDALALVLGPGPILPENNYVRSLGFSLRCP